MGAAEQADLFDEAAVYPAVVASVNGDRSVRASGSRPEPGRWVGDCCACPRPVAVGVVPANHDRGSEDAGTRTSICRGGTFRSARSCVAGPIREEREPNYSGVQSARSPHSERHHEGGEWWSLRDPRSLRPSRPNAPAQHRPVARRPVTTCANTRCTKEQRGGTAHRPVACPPPVLSLHKPRLALGRPTRGSRRRSASSNTSSSSSSWPSLCFATCPSSRRARRRGRQACPSPLPKSRRPSPLRRPTIVALPFAQLGLAFGLVFIHGSASSGSGPGNARHTMQQTSVTPVSMPFFTQTTADSAARNSSLPGCRPGKRTPR